MKVLLCSVFRSPNMDLEDKTPVVEEHKSFPLPSETATSTSSGSTTSASTTSTSTSHSTSSESPRRVPNSERNMSESYHEIFDTLMPPETAKAKVMAAESEAESESADVAVTCRLRPKILADESTASTTRYLTSKLVEDSLKYKNVSASGSPLQSPFSTPVKRVNRHPKAVGRFGGGDPLIDVLDPTCILEIERSAKHLATSVDEMCENLSGVLQGISALTVDTVETYRDGVCKTCDAVDGNIKAMYQVMAKVEELNKSMGPAYRIAEDIKEVKRLLDLFEAAFNSK